MIYSEIEFLLKNDKIEKAILELASAIDELKECQGRNNIQEGIRK